MTAAVTVRVDQNAFAEFAYAGQAAWHGLGQELEEGASIEKWIEAAGMDWLIKQARVRFATACDEDRNPINIIEYDDRKVLFRSDNKLPLGIVSDGYKRVQPREVLEFFRDLTEACGFKLNAAGTLFGGKQFWAIAECNVEAVIADKRDVVKLHLCLVTSADGSMATQAFYCAERVVCKNTLSVALGEHGFGVKVNHRKTFKPDEVKCALGIEKAQSAFEATVARMRDLAAKKVSNEDMVTATATLLHPDFAELDADKQAKILRSKPIETIGRLAVDRKAIGSDLDGADGTAWGWLNAVTEYVDHVGSARTNDARFDSAMFGKGEALKTKAFAMAAELPSLAEVIDSTNAMFPAKSPSILDAVLEATA